MRSLDAFVRTRFGSAIVPLAVIVMAIVNVPVFAVPWDIPDTTFKSLAVTALLIALCQSAILLLAYRQFVAGRGQRVLIVAMLAAIGISCWASFVQRPQSNDVYAYMSYAKLPAFADAYSPPDAPMPAPFLPINRIWGQPLVPCVYGPLWLAYDRALLGSVPTMPAGVTRMRLANIAVLAALIAMLIFLRIPSVFLWLVAMNPMIWNAFVFSAHNDIVAIALSTAAIVAVELGWPLLGVLFVAGAGLSKITFAVIGLIAFVRVPQLRARIGYCVAALVLIAAGSELFGGSSYLAAILHVVHAHQRPIGAAGTALHVAFAGLAVVAVAAALVRRVWIGSAAWSFTALSTFYLPWYAAWGLPFMIASRRYLAPYLISLPVVSTVIFAPLPPLFTAPAVAIACLLLAVIEAWQSRRQRTAVAVATAG